jgi:acetyl-CoA carboxylase beta subunit
VASRIDVSIEHRNVPEGSGDGKPHPNTCPKCESHYREDELEANLRVCPHCGHHFPMRARARIASLADDGSFAEEAAELRSDDPLDFFDLKAYKERLAQAEKEAAQAEKKAPVRKKVARKKAAKSTAGTGCSEVVLSHSASSSVSFTAVRTSPGSGSPRSTSKLS